MRRLASLLILLPAMAFFSCNNNSSAAKEPAADSVKTVAFDFQGWLKHLKTIPHPVHGYDLENIDSALGPFAQSGFASVSAGIVARQKNYLAIAAQGFYKKDSDSSVMLLLVYSPDGKEIGRQEVGMSKEESKGDESNSIHKWPEFINDSTFWVKETWYTYKKGVANGESKARIKQYRINYQGQISAVPQETVPFDTYAGRFKTLTTPFTVNYTLAGLQPVSLLTPYFDFSDLIYFEQIKLFHYGKIPVPGKGTYLLYAVGALEGGESMMDSTIQLVYHTPDGKESSSIRLNGYIGSEGYYSASKNATVAADGTIRVTEESNDEDGVGGEVGFLFKSEELVVYKPENGAKFKRQLVGKNFYSAEFNPADMKELLATRRSNYDAASLDTEFEQALFSVLRDETIYVRMHVYDNGSEQLVEIYTVGTDLRVLDRYVVYNNLKKTPYEKVSARDNVSVDGEIEKDDTVRKLPVNGPVTVTLKDKVLQITPEGKFQAQ